MPAFNPVAIIRSLWPGNRPWAHVRSLIRALRTRPDDLAALAALDDELTRNHRELPLNLLWRIWRLAEKAQAQSSDAAAHRLLDAILRSVTWEVQSRSLRGV